VFSFAEPRKIVSIYQRYRKLSATERKYLFRCDEIGDLIDCLWFFKRGEAQVSLKGDRAMDRLGRDQWFCQALFAETR
jgi:hypothetical protein